MTQEQTKEDFEKWLMSLSQDRLCYLDEESAWTGWMAAHDKYSEGLVVTLPERQVYEDAGFYYDEMSSHEVIAALKEAGVRYK